MGVNIADLAILGVLVLSGLLALARGFVREVLSIGAWIAAALATVYGFPLARPLLRTYIEMPLLADAITGFVIFVATLIAGAALSHALSRRLRGTAFGTVDRSLGLLFGIARGALLVCLAYLLVAWAVPRQNWPPWLAEARSLPLVETGAEWLADLVPEDALDRGAAAAEETRRSLERTVDAVDAVQDLTGAGTNRAAPGPGSGYKEDERKDLDRLLQGLEGTQP
jgi:membrane protein required for colicin V production